MILILFYLLTGELSLAGALRRQPTDGSVADGGVDACCSWWRPCSSCCSTENSRVPVDDPATHLELTMIHEVMILDHSGPDLAFIELGASLKLFFYSALITLLVCPFRFDQPVLDGLLFFGVLTLVYVAVGVTESIMARFRMDKVPMFGLASFALAFFAAVVSLQVMQ